MGADLNENKNHYVPKLTPPYVAKALGLSLHPALAQITVPAFTSITTDSRKIIPGCLFVALKGEQFDGHTFIDQALATGAAGVICQPGTAVKNEGKAAIYFVDDTLEAYRRLAHYWRKDFSIPMIGVAGSVGKTTTKEFLAAILSGKYKSVLKTQGSQNGFIGIPMTLLELKAEHQCAVIEIGIDEIGAMAKHMELVNPNSSILTAIGPEHLEKLIDLPTVAREEGLALSYVGQHGGMVVINLDDPWIRPHAKTLRLGRKFCFSMMESGASEAPGVQAARGQLTPDGNELEVRFWTQENKKFKLPIPGAHNAANLLGAVTMAKALGLTTEEIERGLASFSGIYGRSEVKKMGGMTVICDYYNANPSSVQAGLSLLKDLAKKSAEAGSKRWACLADMLELGTDELKLHRELAKQIIEDRVENVLLYGTRMEALLEELKSSQFSGQLEHFASQAKLAERLISGVKASDTVLIKGSRGMKMEEVFKLFQKGKDAV